VRIVLEGKIAKREAGSAGEAEEMIDCIVYRTPYMILSVS
jgi:hypothetical protein